MTTLSVTIDGRAISVEPGTTVLDAARALGIDIPTLCHVPGLQPVSSCFLCAVQVAGRRTLSPACALPVSEGMVVTTTGPDVLGARKMALELLLSDHAGECVAPCAARCPAGLDIPGFVHEIAAGNSRRCLEIVSDRLTLPGALGRICPRLCEQGCRRGDYDHGLLIGALHRHAADLDRKASVPYVSSRARSTGRSVAIIGAGPAGLAAAHYLLRVGHNCTLFDAQPQPGGMLRYGIPAYRLPREALDAEIEAVRALGAEFRMTMRWGREFTLAQLREAHDAVFVAIGAQRAQGLRCAGGELALSGIEFLERVAKGYGPSPGRTAIVVGGGNTAVDCARTAVRLGAERVRILYRRTRREMPCLMEEVEAAESEGVHMNYLVAPIGLERRADHDLELTCQRMELGEADASGRRRPVALPDSEFVVRCSSVIAALGQAVELELAEREGLQISAWGIAADTQTMATNLPGVFAGGDAVLGADLAVRAVAAGRIAAASIDQFLKGQPVIAEPALAAVTLQPQDDAERAALFRQIERAERVPVHEIDMSRRLTTFDEVVGGLSDADADREARRCMTCGCRKADCCRIRMLATAHDADVTRFAGARRRFSQDDSHPDIVYEPGKCIMCEACVRIAAAAGEALGMATVGRGFQVSTAVPFDEPLSEGLRKVARRCAEACPSGALALRTSRSCDLCAACGLEVAAVPRPVDSAPRDERHRKG